MKIIRWTAVFLTCSLITSCSASPPQEEGGEEMGEAAQESFMDPQEGAQEPQEGGIDSQGDCVSIGEGNQINCTFVTLPTQVDEFGGIALGWDMATVYFDGPIEEVPDPPDYPMVLPGEGGEWSPEEGAPAGVMNHCSTWEEWFQENDRIYRSHPNVDASLWGGAEELVAITGVSVQVFERPEPTSEGTVLTCVYGAGSNPGSMISVDTESTVTTLTNYMDEELSGQMPPASLSMNDPSGSPTLNAMIQINSPRYLYSGMLTVEGRVGSEAPYIHVGSPEEPIRWLGELGYEKYESSPRYGWNVETQEWVMNFHPGMLESLDWY